MSVTHDSKASRNNRQVRSVREFEQWLDEMEVMRDPWGLISPMITIYKFGDDIFIPMGFGHNMLNREALRNLIENLEALYERLAPEFFDDLDYQRQLREDARQQAVLRERHAPKKKQATRKKHAGFVYLLHSDSGYYKIGRTKNPKSRIKTFQVKLPFMVKFEHLIETSDMHELEQELHTKFDGKRVNGEWFNLDAEDVAYIKSLGGAQ